LSTDKLIGYRAAVGNFKVKHLQISQKTSACLSFHIRLMARIEGRREPEGTEAQQEVPLVTNRKLVQVSEVFDPRR